MALENRQARLTCDLKSCDETSEVDLDDYGEPKLPEDWVQASDITWERELIPEPEHERIASLRPPKTKRPRQIGAGHFCTPEHAVAELVRQIDEGRAFDKAAKLKAKEALERLTTRQTTPT